MATILVIDDEAPLLEEVELILRFGGYDVLSTTKPQEGVEIATHKLPDLIVCDVMMPYVNGYSVLQRLRTNPTTAHIPFIFLTALSTYGDLRQGMELGADDYLTKPFTHTDLLNAIAVRLDKHQKVRSAQLRQLSSDLVQAQAAERDHIARQLQEKVGQVLQSAGLIIDTQKRHMDPFVTERLDVIHQLIDKAAAQVVEISMDLHPLLLDQLGLLPTLNWFLDRYAQRTQRTATLGEVTLSPDTLLSPEIRRVMYWIVREMLQVIVPILDMDNIQIDLRDYGTHLELQILGKCGSQSPPIESHFLRLYEYAFSVGGSLNFDFLSNTSARLRASIPLIDTAPITLLATANPITPLSHPLQSILEGRTLTVTLISSHAGTRDVLQRLLTDASDINVIAAHENANEILSIDSTVIILDLSGKNDLEAMNNLIKQYPQIPLLVIGNNSEETAVLEVMRAQASGYILRNAGKDELLNAVYQIYNGRRYLSSPFREQAIEYYVHAKRSSKDQVKFQTLTPREREILDWVTAGYTSAEIAERLNLSPRTVETHRNNLMRKLSVHSKWELIGYVTADRSESE
jgi:two-component system, OmpR family, alkaline phosphatase synthesis response regulator PhoP